MPVHTAVSCMVKSYAPWIFIFFNLWFQDFFVNHLTLCLITSFVLHPWLTLMSWAASEKTMKTEKIQCFRKNTGSQEFIWGSLTDVAALRLTRHSHEDIVRFGFVPTKSNQVCKDPSLDFYCKMKKHLFYSFLRKPRQTLHEQLMNLVVLPLLLCDIYTVFLNFSSPSHLFLLEKVLQCLLRYSNILLTLLTNMSFMNSRMCLQICVSELCLVIFLI